MKRSSSSIIRTPPTQHERPGERSGHHLGGPPHDLAEATIAELQAAGLLDYAASIRASVIQDVPPDVLQGTLLQAQGGDYPSRAKQGHAGPSDQHQPAPQPLPQHSPLEMQHYASLNQAADLASTRANQMLQVTRLRVHQLVSSYNPRSTASGNEGSGKRRKTSRNADGSGGRAGGKGLRHFSMKVCEKVESKGRTTYNEVADELVAEMSRIELALGGQFDEKNIRRRVYDAINVLMAMDIIQKEKKEILWKGFPKTAGNALDRLRSERVQKIKEVESKQAYLQDMIEQQKALKKLLERSVARGSASQSGTQLHLPFILVQAKPDATVEVKISEDMSDVQFDFYHSPFQIHDDSYVLKNIALQQQLQQLQAAPSTGAAPVAAPAAHAPVLSGPQPLQTPAGAAGTSDAATAAAAAAAQPLGFAWQNGAGVAAAGGPAAALAHQPLSPMADPALLAAVASKGNPHAFAGLSPHFSYPPAAAAAYFRPPGPQAQQQLGQPQMGAAQLGQLHTGQPQLSQQQMGQAPLGQQQQLGQQQLNPAHLGRPQMGQPQLAQAPQMGQQLGQPQMGQPMLNHAQMSQAQMSQLSQAQLGQLSQAQLGQLSQAQQLGQLGAPMMMMMGQSPTAHMQHPQMAHAFAPPQQQPQQAPQHPHLAQQAHGMGMGGAPGAMPASAVPAPAPLTNSGPPMQPQAFPALAV